MSSWLLYSIFLYGRLYYALWFTIFVATIAYLVFRSVKFLIVFEDSIHNSKYIDEAKTELNRLKRTIYFTLLIAVIINLIPSRNQLLFIWGLPKLTNNQNVTDLSQRSWKYLDEYLNREIKELKMKLNEYNSTENGG